MNRNSLISEINNLLSKADARQLSLILRFVQRLIEK